MHGHNHHDAMSIPTSPYWQLSIDSPGAVVEGINDIRQCLFVILTTEKGSDPLRPDFGADIYKAVDLPAARIAPILKASILEQVELYEPRVEVLSVSIAYKTESHVAVRLSWKAKADALATIQNLDAELFR